MMWVEAKFEACEVSERINVASARELGDFLFRFLERRDLDYPFKETLAKGTIFLPTLWARGRDAQHYALNLMLRNYPAKGLKREGDARFREIVRYVARKSFAKGRKVGAA